MKFGVTLLADDLGKLAERARLAEQIGFDYIGVADSQSLFRELYVSLTVVAQVTSQARIGTAVTNPLTRHPAVTSSAIASIDELSHGRPVRRGLDAGPVPGKGYGHIGGRCRCTVGYRDRPPTGCHHRAVRSGGGGVCHLVPSPGRLCQQTGEPGRLLRNPVDMLRLSEHSWRRMHDTRSGAVRTRSVAVL